MNSPNFLAEWYKYLGPVIIFFYPFLPKYLVNILLKKATFMCGMGFHNEASKIFCILFISFFCSLSSSLAFAEINQLIQQEIKSNPEGFKLEQLASFSKQRTIKRYSPFQEVFAIRQDVNIKNADSQEQGQQFTLDSLKFVGVLQEGNRIWGLLKQPDGEVHAVKVGDYLGGNLNQVIGISATRLMLQSGELSKTKNKKIVHLHLTHF